MKAFSAKQIMTLGLTLLVVCVTGCQSSPRLVKGEAQMPVTPLAFTAEDGSVELAVTGLIAFDRPGSWMKQAYWDEYNVRVENHRPDPIIIEEIILGDALDRSVAPESDPWRLEKRGHKHEKYLQSLCAPADAFASAHPKKAKAYAATGGAAAVAMVTVAGAAPLFVYGAPVVVLAATPVALVDQVFIAPGNRKLVRAEFNRRRLVLPVRLEPGASVGGSVFFPLTPGPERLTLRWRAGENPFALTMAMPGLEGLHFTYVPDRAALKAAKPYRGLLSDGPWKPMPMRKVQPVLSAVPQ